MPGRPCGREPPAKTRREPATDTGALDRQSHRRRRRRGRRGKAVAALGFGATAPGVLIGDAVIGLIPACHMAVVVSSGSSDGGGVEGEPVSRSADQR